MSASLCWIAWNEPIGTSNCLRSFAYASAMSKMRRAVPTISAAMRRVGAVAPRARTRRRSSGCAVELRRASSRNRRREKSTVATKRAGDVGGVDRRASRGPGEHDRDAVDAVGLEHEGLDRVVDERDGAGRGAVVAGRARRNSVVARNGPGAAA